MKLIRQLAVAAALGVGLVSCAQAHVFVGIGVGVCPARLIRLCRWSLWRRFMRRRLCITHRHRRRSTRRPWSLAITDIRRIWGLLRRLARRIWLLASLMQAGPRLQQVERVLYLSERGVI